jgi:hypothetical protein
MQGVFKKSFTTLKAYINLFGGYIYIYIYIYSVLNCHNVAKHTKFYLE